MAKRGFDYQSNRHCAKTALRFSRTLKMFDYQSNRHCAKTWRHAHHAVPSLITSQIDTVPKRPLQGGFERHCLITSQIDTVPKHSFAPVLGEASLITSQIDTVPKHDEGAFFAYLV